MRCWFVTIDQKLWLDLRPYMDTAPYSTNQSASVQRCYRYHCLISLPYFTLVGYSALWGCDIWWLWIVITQWWVWSLVKMWLNGDWICTGIVRYDVYLEVLWCNSWNRDEICRSLFMWMRFLRPLYTKIKIPLNLLQMCHQVPHYTRRMTPISLSNNRRRSRKINETAIS